jgi:hypothetical protein
MAECALTLPGVVAGIMIGGELMVNGFVHLDAAFVEILLQKVVNADELDTLIGKPFLQTKPGRIVGVPSFG